MGITIGVKTNSHAVLSSAYYDSQKFQDFIADMIDDCAEYIKLPTITVNGIKLSNLVILVGEDAKLTNEPLNLIASMFADFPNLNPTKFLYGNAVICVKSESYGLLPLSDIEASVVIEMLDYIRRNVLDMKV